MSRIYNASKIALIKAAIEIEFPQFIVTLRPRSISVAFILSKRDGDMVGHIRISNYDMKVLDTTELIVDTIDTLKEESVY